MYISYSAARKAVQRSTLQGCSFRSHTGARIQDQTKNNTRLCIPDLHSGWQ